MEKKYIIALDQGTTSSRCVIYDKNFNIVIKEQIKLNQIYPENGYVEFDPFLILDSIKNALHNAISKSNILVSEIISIGITNQRETVILWDKLTGKPVYNAICWQCKRTSSFCDSLIKNGYSKLIKDKTGLNIDPYFSATKIKWVLENCDICNKLILEDRLLCGTVDTWLIWNLTKEKNHFTDYTNASRTMLFNINSLVYDKDLLKLFNIPLNILPEVKNSNDLFGHIKINNLDIPIKSVLGDQQSSFFGQKCFNIGDVKNTYGTGCFILMNIGDKPVYDNNGLLTTIGYKINDKICYCLEGSIFMAGALLEWLKDDLNLIDDISKSSDIALSLDDSNGVYIVPAFQGLGTPYWDYKARGTIFGLTRGTNKNHLIRASLESIAFQVKDIILTMEKSSNKKISILKVDGGASKNDFLMQFQSDILNTKVIRNKMTEATSLGTAMLACYNDINLDDITSDYDIFINNMDINKNTMLYKNWEKAILHTKNWL